MADDPGSIKAAQTLQLDVSELAKLTSDYDADAQVVDGGGSLAPPPLPPRSSIPVARPSQAPRPSLASIAPETSRTKLIGLSLLAALCAIAAAIGLTLLLTGEEPAPDAPAVSAPEMNEPEMIELAPIELTPVELPPIELGGEPEAP